MKMLSGPSADGAEASRCVTGEQAKTSGKTPWQKWSRVTQNPEIPQLGLHPKN